MNASSSVKLRALPAIAAVAGDPARSQLLLPAARWPDGERIQGSPVSVRFRYSWESSAPGRLLGGILGSISK